MKNITGLLLPLALAPSILKFLKLSPMDKVQEEQPYRPKKEDSASDIYRRPDGKYTWEGYLIYIDPAGSATDYADYILGR